MTGITASFFSLQSWFIHREARPFSWLHRKIFDYKLPSAPVERGTAAKAWCLAVTDIGDLHSDNFVSGPAVWADERYGLSFDHAGDAFAKLPVLLCKS